MRAIGVVGAGVMGSGIAQVAASHGYDVILSDISEPVAQRGVDTIRSALQRLLDRGKITGPNRDATLARLHIGAAPSAFAPCELIIEAVAEKMDVKVEVLGTITPHLAEDAILASNTSSLSISRIGDALGQGHRMVGMHFFNPVPLMPLVEVISGNRTSPQAADAVAEIARNWGKTVVRAKDTPGFIVNRVARGYYLEALRLLGEGLSGVSETDQTMRDLGGFRMGPFELMDLVGIDVNYSVSESVWQQLGQPARLMPHPIQADLFAKGQWGRKTKRGFYDHAKERPTPVVQTNPRPFRPSQSLQAATQEFTLRGAQRVGTPLENYVFSRILGAILNEAAFALGAGVATRTDIDTAMRLGTNYPKGPLEWAGTIGLEHCRRVLEELNTAAGDGRYAPAPLLEGQRIPE